MAVKYENLLRELNRLGSLNAKHGPITTALTDVVRRLVAAIDDNAPRVRCCKHHRTGGLLDDPCGRDAFDGYRDAKISLQAVEDLYHDAAE